MERSSPPARSRWISAFALDPLSMMMTLIITFIGTLIHVFSIGYMADEPSYWRFFSYLNLFIFSMLLLVMGDNFVLMFFGWEGVGLCSYLLIAFWYTDPQKAAAGMKAFIVNRFGDFGFLLGLFLLFWALGGAWQKAPDGRHDATSRPTAHAAAYVAAARGEGHGARATSSSGPTLNFRELRDQVVIKDTGRGREAEVAEAVRLRPAGRGRHPAVRRAPWARARSCRCTCGCPTPWPAPRRSRP